MTALPSAPNVCGYDAPRHDVLNLKAACCGKRWTRVAKSHRAAGSTHNNQRSNSDRKPCADQGAEICYGDWRRRIRQLARHGAGFAISEISRSGK
jgi:hypothetical protein